MAHREALQAVFPMLAEDFAIRLPRFVTNEKGGLAPSQGTNKLAQWPGCGGVSLIEPPRATHWLGGSVWPFSTCATSRSNDFCACGWISSSCGKRSWGVSG